MPPSFTASGGVTARLVLGLVLAPMLELTFRQSLAMSAGSYAIFVTRPITAVMLVVGLALLLLGLRPIFTGRVGWRAAIGLEPAARREGQEGSP